MGFFFIEMLSVSTDISVRALGVFLIEMLIVSSNELRVSCAELLWYKMHCLFLY